MFVEQITNNTLFYNTINLDFFPCKSNDTTPHIPQIISQCTVLSNGIITKQISLCYFNHINKTTSASLLLFSILFIFRWWKDVTFTIESNRSSKTQFLCNTFGRIVTNATIKFDSLSEECVSEFVKLMGRLAENYNLRSLVIEPRYCQIVSYFS